jgi:hypothetical protein
MAKKIYIKNGETENTIWNFLKKEIWLIGIFIGIFATIYINILTPINKIQTDIATIQVNHEVHMQEALEAIKTLQEEQIKQNEEITELLKSTTETQTLIKLHMGIK